MKRIVVFLLFALLLFFVPFEKSKDIPLFDIKNTYQVCLVCGEDEEVENYDEIISTCGAKFVYCSKSEAKELLSLINTVSAIQFYMENISIKKLIDILDLVVLEEQSFENLNIIYGYSPLFHDSIYIKNKKVNVQIAVRNDIVIAGFPLILTGY